MLGNLFKKKPEIVGDQEIYLRVNDVANADGGEIHMCEQTERALSRHLAEMTDNDTMPVLGSFRGHPIVIDQTLPVGHVCLVFSEPV